MSRTIALDIPTSATERLAATEATPAPISAEWLEHLQAHIDEDGLIGERAAKCLLAEVIRLRAVLAEISRQYENPNLSHVEFRVAARQAADAALTTN